MLPLFVDWKDFETDPTLEKKRREFVHEAGIVCLWDLLTNLMRYVEDWTAALQGKEVLHNLTALSTDFGRFWMSSSENDSS